MRIGGKESSSADMAYRTTCESHVIVGVGFKETSLIVLFQESPLMIEHPHETNDTFFRIYLDTGSQVLFAVAIP